MQIDSSIRSKSRKVSEGGHVLTVDCNDREELDRISTSYDSEKYLVKSRELAVQAMELISADLAAAKGASQGTEGA